MIQTVHNGLLTDLLAESVHGEHTEMLKKTNVRQLMTHARHGAKQTETVSNVMTAMETHSSMVKPSMANANSTMEKKNKQSHHSNMMSIVNVIQIRWSVLNAMSLFTWIQKGNANQPQQDAKLSKMKLVLSVSKDIHLTPKENAWYCLPIAQRWMRMEPALNANRDSS